MTDTVKLCERSYVKNFLQMPLADTRQDAVINEHIQQASAEAELYTRRKFTYGQYTEYYPAYEQTIIGLDRQVLLVDAAPIDTTQPIYLAFSPFNHIANTIIVLQWSPQMEADGSADFTVRADKGQYDVLKLGILTANFPVFAGVGFTYSERGFKTVYTGGYPVTTVPNDPNFTPDPIDDFGVVQVPESLKLIVARKAAFDYRALRAKDSIFQKRGQLNPVQSSMDEFRQSLKPWTKKDMLF